MKHILSKDKENKKRNGWPRAIIIGVFIALLSVAGWSLREIWQEYNLPAEEIVIKAIDNTLEHESYSFHLVSRCNRKDIPIYDLDNSDYSMNYRN